MIRKRVYIETTIPRFYYEIRKAPEMVARQIEDEIYDLVDDYIENRVMPQDPRCDALHLALASYHHCHFLLTWNCAHLANANKFEHIRHVNTLPGYFVPILTTPFELLNWEEGD